MNRKVTWLTKLVVYAAIVTIFPVGNLVAYLWVGGASQYRVGTPREQQDLKNLAKKLIVEARAKGKDYKAKQYFEDGFVKLIIPIRELRLDQNEYQPDISTLHELARSNYPPNDLMGFDYEFNPLWGQHFHPGSRDGDFSFMWKMAWWFIRKYLEFMPFAFLLIVLWIDSKRKQMKLLDELMDFRNFLAAVVLWPYGLYKYGDGDYDGVITCRYLRLRAHYVAAREGRDVLSYYRISDEEDARLWEEAKKSGDYLAQVAKLANVPRELVARQSTALALTSLCCSVLSFSIFTILQARVAVAMTKVAHVVMIVQEKTDLGPSPDPDLTDGSGLGSTFQWDYHFDLFAVLPSTVLFQIRMTIQLCFAEQRRPPPAPVFPVDYVPW